MTAVDDGGVYLIKVDGSGLRRLVDQSGHNPVWSPNGRWIAYATANRSTESRAFGAPEEADDIWIVKPDGTYDMRLTDDLSAEWWPAWGRDRVFFVSNRGGTPNVWSLKVKPLDDPEDK